MVFDSGFSIAVTPHLEDFVGEVKQVKNEMSGISSTAQVEEEENMNCSIYDDYEVI